MRSSLESFVQDLATALGVTFQVDQGIYSIEIATAGKRRQAVQISARESGVGGPMLLFYTPVGPIVDEMDWCSLLELNVGTVYARVGIVGDQIVVAAGQMLDSADIRQAMAMLNEVGTLGDVLESLFFGQDRF
jgi:hypothetical protein